ncbi:MFS transporter [Plastorhodobacter daqingensis]|uniref:MFS transporter n=1 Tax=Plastorhodobacter daqingensis TaxID=1387281 RepID=A0ABW2UIY6_9RHOB
MKNKGSELAQPRSAFAPFRHPAFRTLWTATLVSNLGGLVQGVGAAWAMTLLTPSPTLIALVQTTTTLPVMLFAMASGALADSFDRRRIMLLAQVLMLLVSVALAVTAWMGGLTPRLLLAFTFLIGAGGALHNPSWQASMGDLVSRDDLPAAVSLNSVGFNLMRSIGPAAGGLIVATLGAAAAFAFNAASYVPLIAALFRWRPETRPRLAPREGFVPAMGAGLRYVALSPNLLRVLARGLFFGLTGASVLALLPLVVRDMIGGGSFLYGLLLGAFGLGAIGGALLNPWLRATLANERIVQIAFLAMALAAAALSQSHTLWLSVLAMLPAGAAWVLALSLFNVTVQLSTPRWVVGRALALYQMATFGGLAAGAWIWGVVASAQGVDVALIGSAAGLGLGAVLGLWVPVPQFGTLDLDPAGRFREPVLRLDMRGRSGPIMVMIDYRIDQADVPAFLAAMGERRRIRRRDGARNWALLRDLEEPELWSESYHVATWDEYLRHNLRRTKADIAVSERILALHRGPDQPRVHRMIERHNVSPEDDLPLRSADPP